MKTEKDNYVTKLIMFASVMAMIICALCYVEWVLIPDFCTYVDSLDMNPNTGRPLDLDIYDCGMFGEQTVSR